VKEFATDNIRNVCLAGQRGCGKTSLGDAIAFNTGVNSRIGRVDDGSSVLDHYPGEISRKTTLSSKLLACSHKSAKVNLLDAPGHPEFSGEMLAALHVSDSVGFVIDATAGVEIGTQLQWRDLGQYQVARFFFINKMEKENVNWREVLKGIKEIFGKQAVAVQIPIGEGPAFKGLIDLLHMKAYEFDDKGKRTEIDVPADMKDEAQSQRENLIEVAAESDDALLEKFFNDGTLGDDDVLAGLRKGIVSGTLFPVLFGSAQKNAGVQVLLDFIVEYLPAPNQLGPRQANKTGRDDAVELNAESSGPATAFVYKTMSEGHLGELSYLRVVSGSLKPGVELANQQTKSSERMAHLYTLAGKDRVDVDGLAAGDIGVVVKLKDTHTGNTLSSGSVSVPAVNYPNPIMDIAVKPKSKGDEDKVATGLAKLREEDPTFRLVPDPALKQLVLWAQGSTHMEVLVERLKDRFGVEVELNRPRIPYRETIRKKGETQYRHKKQSGGRGQYGDVHIRLEPSGRGAGFEFIDAITGGVIPSKYIPAVEKGIVESMEHGALAKAPVVDVKVTLFFGSYHDVDSSDMAFKIAGSMAFKEGFLKCDPVLLEPIYNIEVFVPDDFTGDVMGDLSSRRGKIAGMDPDGRSQRIRASVPQAELYQYSVDLRSMTQGQGVYTMEFSHYEEVPRDTQEKVIAEAKAVAEQQA
jgi:elongation factor G